MASFNITPDQCNIVGCYSDWQKVNDTYDELEDFNSEECSLVTRILTIDFAHWIMWHTSGGVIDQYNCDELRGLKNDLIKLYEKTFNKPYIDINSANIYG